MNSENIRNANGKVIGKMNETEVKDANNKRLGRYDKSSNSTFDANGKFIGYGNLMATLLDM